MCAWFPPRKIQAYKNHSWHLTALNSQKLINILLRIYLTRGYKFWPLSWDSKVWSTFWQYLSINCPITSPIQIKECISKLTLSTPNCGGHAHTSCHGRSFSLFFFFFLGEGEESNLNGQQDFHDSKALLSLCKEKKVLATHKKTFLASRSNLRPLNIAWIWCYNTLRIRYTVSMDERQLWNKNSLIT